MCQFHKVVFCFMPSIPVAVAIGSNLGDREKIIQEGLSRLEVTLSNIQLSPFIETVPSGVLRQPLFLNAALVGTTEVTLPRYLVHGRWNL